MPPVTDSERYLAALCRRSFLSLWSYPNLYTDEGMAHGHKQGRELCDLLVVFGDDVLIFSDKHVSYKDTGNPAIDWPRWRRKAVTSSMKQLYGAESWLRRFPARVFIDRECTKPFPIAFPAEDRIRVHRIAVTRGSFEACKTFFGGKSIGSLMLTNEPDGDGLALPFQVGAGLAGKPFVHVLDEFTLDLLFEHLDTLADFVTYLRKKEAFVGMPARLVTVAGEEQLLAIYLRTLNGDGEHDILLPKEMPPDIDAIHLAEGYWEEISDSPRFRAKREADRVSYLWDAQIERFIELGSLRVFGMDIDQSPTDRELALRQMAAEPRVRRRHLATMLLDVRRRSAVDKSYARVFTERQMPDLAYVFLAEAKPPEESYEEYRQYRIARLAAYCEVATLKYPQAKRVIGLAIDSYDPERRGSSEDLFTLDASNRDSEEIEEAKRIQQEFGILLPENIQEQKWRDREFPVDEREILERQKHNHTGKRRDAENAKKRKARMRKHSQQRNRQK